MRSSTSTTQLHVTISRADWNGFEICSTGSRMSKLNAADPSSMFCEGCKANYVETYRLSSELPQFPPIGFPLNDLLELPGNLSTSEVGTDDAYVLYTAVPNWAFGGFRGSEHLSVWSVWLEEAYPYETIGTRICTESVGKGVQVPATDNSWYNLENFAVKAVTDQAEFL